MDYTSLDTRRHRLFIAHLGQGEVIVVDTRTRGVLARIPAPGVHGILAVPQLGKVYAAASDSAEALTIEPTRSKSLPVPTLAEPQTASHTTQRTAGSSYPMKQVTSSRCSKQRPGSP